MLHPECDGALMVALNIVFDGALYGRVRYGVYWSLVRYMFPVFAQRSAAVGKFSLFSLIGLNNTRSQ